jgi:hypothetical protein
MNIEYKTVWEIFFSINVMIILETVVRKKHALKIVFDQI